MIELLQTAKKSALCSCVTYAPNACRIALPICNSCLGTGLRDRDRQKTIARNTERLLPTYADFLNFDGQHCKNIYRRLPRDWRCPACKRSIFELLRWATRFPKSPTPFKGWVMGFHEHHDHQSDCIVIDGQLRPIRRFPRFLPTVLCEQCNSADASAKKKLKLPAEFSFSPVEIGTFVTATPHGWHLLDYRVAQELYTRIQAAPPCPYPF